MESKDSIKRRNRYIPQSTGKRVSLKSRDMRWLEALRDHGPLASHYLHAFTETSHSNEKSTRIRLTDLFNEKNTPHKGTYLSRPPAQRSGANALNRSLIYNLTKAGWVALGESHLKTSRPGGPFRHQFMVACVTASIEIACLRSSHMRFIPGWKILKRSGAALGCETTITIPPGKTQERHALIPDQLFAVEYCTEGRKSYLAFIVECDRSTEPLTSSNYARKSYLRSYLQYREFVGASVYKSHYGLKANCMVLNVMNSADRQKKFLDLIRRNAPNGNSYMAFQTIEGVGQSFECPPILETLISKPWARAGSSDIALNRLD